MMLGFRTIEGKARNDPFWGSKPEWDKRHIEVAPSGGSKPEWDKRHIEVAGTNNGGQGTAGPGAVGDAAGHPRFGPRDRGEGRVAGRHDPSSGREDRVQSPGYL